MQLGSRFVKLGIGHLLGSANVSDAEFTKSALQTLADKRRNDPIRHGRSFLHI